MRGRALIGLAAVLLTRSIGTLAAETAPTVAEPPCDAGTTKQLFLDDYVIDRLQRPLKYDPERVEFPGDEQANRLLDYPKRAPWRIF